MPGRKEQLQRELKRSVKNCLGLGEFFSKHTKKTAGPQEEVELLKENEDDSTIRGQSLPSNFLVMSRTQEVILKMNTMNQPIKMRGNQQRGEHPGHVKKLLINVKTNNFCQCSQNKRQITPSRLTS